MVRLPNSQRAIIDLRKIENYCLAPAHPRGRHKARVFREALGLLQPDAPWLREVILEAAQTGEATELVGDTFGSRWSLDVTIARRGKRAVVRTIWIILIGEEVPRFVTCWVL